MTKIAGRYIDPLTDYGFKHIFGNEPDKDIMIDFLNALFEGEKIIVDKIPDFMDKRTFQKIFRIAEMSKMTKEERELYHSDVKAKSDWNARYSLRGEKGS